MVIQEHPKERQRIKLLLAKQETLFPNIFSSLQRAMKPLIRQENIHYLNTNNSNDNTALCKIGDCALAADEEDMVIDIDKIKQQKNDNTIDTHKTIEESKEPSISA